jgi:pimeloyl-ACP methyl ester carboxylesterase
MVSNVRSPIRSSSVVVDDTATRLLEVPGSGPPILLLHGFSDSADSWRPLLDSLAARRRRAIAADLPGFGRSTRPPRGPVLARLDDFTAALVRRYAGARPVVLAGNSMGGLLALRAAQRGDLPLQAVAGIAPAGLSYTPHLSGRVDRARSLQHVLSAARYVLVPRRVLRAGLAHLYNTRLSGGGADPSLGHRYASHYRNTRDVHRLIPMMIALSDETDRDPLALEEITIPVALILGRRDRLVPVDAARVMLDSLPHASLTVFDDCGHCPQVQRPDDIADLLVALASSEVPVTPPATMGG